MAYIHLATEDVLSEAVGVRLVSDFLPSFEVDLKLRKNGNGYLRKKIPAFCEIANQSPLLLITDLDANHCAASLRAAWLGRIDLPQNLIFRIAVREIEAWLIADSEGIRELIGTGASKLPRDIEAVANPKEFLLQLVALGAPRDIKRDMLVVRGSVASQGLGYNQRLSDYVNSIWSPQRAARRSDSLARAIRRLRALHERF